MKNETQQFKSWKALMQGGSAVDGTDWAKNVTVIGPSQFVGCVTVKDDSGAVFEASLHQLHKIG